MVKEEQTTHSEGLEIERLKVIIRRYMATLKGWQNHVSRMGQILGCDGIDETVEHAARAIVERNRQLEIKAEDTAALRQRIAELEDELKRVWIG